MTASLRVELTSAGGTFAVTIFSGLTAVPQPQVQRGGHA
jgi:hypothetical protein